MKIFNIMETAFENFDETIDNYLNKVLNDLGIKQGKTQIFNIIFKGIKGVAQNIMFYIEDALTEQNIYTASRKKSIYSLAKISGFEASYGTAASGILIGTLQMNTVSTDLAETKLYISNNTIIKNKNTGLRYILQIPNDFYVFDTTKALTTHEFKIVEGTMTMGSYIASGYSLETVRISSISNYDKNYLEVYVNGIQYTQASNIYEMTRNSREFVCSVGFDNTFDITFGNGIFGKRLHEGDSVIVKYLLHNGSQGNVASDALCEFVFESGVTDASGNTIDGNNYISLKMYNCISGGTNEDDIDLVRSMIGYNSRSNVLINENNFNLFFKRFSFVGNCNIWIEKNSMNVNTIILRNVSNDLKTPYDYLNIDESKLYLNSHEKEMLVESLNNSNKSYAGLTLNVYDPEIRKYAMICYVKASNNYNHDIINENIRNIIATYFMNINFGTDFISKSIIIKYVLDNVDNIESFDFDFISALAEQCYHDGYYYDYQLKIVNNELTYIKVKIFYEKDKQPGLDDFGNIQLNSKLEMALLHSGFKYYPNKDTYDKISCVEMNDPIQIYYIE